MLLYMLIFSVYLWFTVSVNAFIAYDCTNEMSDFQILDTTDMRACELNLTEYVEKSVEIQLLQTQEFTTTSVLQCYISVDMTIRHCGMHSHISMVSGGEFNFVKTLTEAECKEAWKDQSVKVLGSRINGLNRNGVTSTSITVAGSVTNGGDCTPGSFTFQARTWTKVVAIAKLDIRLYQYKATVSRDDDKIKLRKGLECKFSLYTCLDSEEGQIFWDPLDSDICFASRYDVLYSGPAVRQESNVSSEVQTVFSVRSNGHIFALMTTKPVEICGITAYATEHPKLFIAPKVGSGWYFTKHALRPESVNLFTYLNSKFVFLERHIKHEMERLYKNVLESRCTTNKLLWYNQLSLLTTSPIDFAYAVKQSPGYMAVVLGELVYITKCMPVNVQVRQSTRCYQELPILYNNQSFFMTPRHHLVTKTGAEVECSSMLYSAYKLHGQWWGQTPSLVHVPDPDVMSIKFHNDWKYHTSGDLINSGIYSEQDLEKYRKFLTNPNGRQASISNLGSIVMGLDIDRNSMNLHALVTEQTVDAMVKGYMKYVWGGFVDFGEVVSGCLGVYIMIRLLKFIIDTVIHGLTLYPLYGCSIYLIASIWDAVTIYLFRKKARNQNQPSDPEENEKLDTCVVDEVPPKPILLPKPSAPARSSKYPRLNP